MEKVLVEEVVKDLETDFLHSKTLKQTIQYFKNLEREHSKKYSELWIEVQMWYSDVDVKLMGKREETEVEKIKRLKTISLKEKRELVAKEKRKQKFEELKKEFGG